MSISHSVTIFCNINFISSLLMLNDTLSIEEISHSQLVLNHISVLSSETCTKTSTFSASILQYLLNLFLWFPVDQTEFSESFLKYPLNYKTLFLLLKMRMGGICHPKVSQGADYGVHRYSAVHERCYPRAGNMLLAESTRENKGEKWII